MQLDMARSSSNETSRQYVLTKLARLDAGEGVGHLLGKESSRATG
jgi:hypothetical protein